MVINLKKKIALLFLLLALGTAATWGQYAFHIRAYQDTGTNPMLTSNGKGDDIKVVTAEKLSPACDDDGVYVVSLLAGVLYVGLIIYRRVMHKRTKPEP